MKQQFTIYDDTTIETDKKFTLKFVVATNIISFFIGFGFHILLY